MLIRARYPIIYVVTWEEERVEQRLLEIAKKRNKKLYVWTCTQGMVQYGAEPQRGKTGAATRATRSPRSTPCSATSSPAIFLFKDFHDHLDVRVCPATCGSSAGCATSPTRCATRTRRSCSSRRS